MALDFWYHGQFRSYIVQVIRAFSGFQTASSFDAQGNPVGLKVVPVKLASQDRMVASIIGNNSENTILSTPSMSIWLTNVELPAQRRQAPNHVDTLQVHEREIDTIANRYTTERGKSYTVERFMPVPYDLTFQLDIWTSNIDQKCQILEQIMVLFNPAIDLQTNTNALDWTALGVMELESMVWDTRTIPIGTSSDMMISTMTFKVPAWINPPAKVQKYRVVEQIVQQITQLDPDAAAENRDFDGAALNWSASGDVFARDIVTPNDHVVELNGNVLQLLGADTKPLNGLGEPWNWINLFELYGKYRPGISQIRLKTTKDIEDWESDVVGTIQVDDTDKNLLTITIDPTTLPMNTLPAVDAVIDPKRTWYVPAGDPPCPNPPPTLTPPIGTRYVILDGIAPNTTWGSLAAFPNDIIEFGSDLNWHVVFDASVIGDSYTLVNERTGKQMTWTGQQWEQTLSGYYGPGYWRIAL